MGNSTHERTTSVTQPVTSARSDNVVLERDTLRDRVNRITEERDHAQTGIQKLRGKNQSLRKENDECNEYETRQQNVILGHRKTIRQMNEAINDLHKGLDTTARQNQGIMGSRSPPASLQVPRSHRYRHIRWD